MDAETSREKLRILIVDDEEVARSSLREFLEDQNFAVHAVESGPQALSWLERSPMDILVADLVMPKMDGIDLTRAAKALQPDIHVIIMTGYGTIERAVESMKAGAADFITKPLAFDHILHIISRFQETQRLRRLAHEREYYRDLSNVDDLTGIFNHRYFMQVLQTEISRQKRYRRSLALMMIDIDNFKDVNDRFGHSVGDATLKEIAQLLQKSIRGCDFVARYGGEEFMVILPETAETEAAQVGERILTTIRQHAFRKPDGEAFGSITVTIGLSACPQDARERQKLIDRADHALYAGKHSGKDRLTAYSRCPKKVPADAPEQASESSSQRR